MTDDTPNAGAQAPQGQDQAPERDLIAAAAYLAGVKPMTLEEVEKVFTKWLGDDDPVPLRVALATFVANELLVGDPVWVMVVGGSGFGKTETISPIATLDHVKLVSSITGEGALLNATPRRDHAKGATGGLLREIGDHGVLVVKDFTTILSMHRDSRAQVLAALREIADGVWVRHVGTDGAKSIEWRGKLGMIAGVTTAIDGAHAVMATMGARWLFIRTGEDDDCTALGARALANVGHEAEMRAELATAVQGLLIYGERHEPHKITRPVEQGLVALANLTTVARSPVERDGRRQVTLVGDREAPTRVVKALGQIWRACGVIGLGPDESWELVRRLAGDSIPKTRRCIVRTLTVNRMRTPEPITTGTVEWVKLLDAASTGVRPPEKTWTWASTSDVALACKLPRSTVKEALEDLMVHGLAEQWQQADGDEAKTRPYWWRMSPAAYEWVVTWQVSTVLTRLNLGDETM